LQAHSKENFVVDVISSMAVGKRIFASSLKGKFCSKCFCFLQTQQRYVFVAISRPTMNSPVSRSPLVGDFRKFKRSVKEVKRKGCRVE
jgi:hypothetical protein